MPSTVEDCARLISKTLLVPSWYKALVSIATRCSVDKSSSHHFALVGHVTATKEARFSTAYCKSNCEHSGSVEEESRPTSATFSTVTKSLPLRSTEKHLPSAKREAERSSKVAAVS